MITPDECTSRHRAVRDTLDVIGGKWKIIILTVLLERSMQFNALCREIGISPRILTRELRDLEVNKLVSRTEQETRPVTVVYAATPHADTLAPLIAALSDWGYQHYEAMSGTRRANDPRPA